MTYALSASLQTAVFGLLQDNMQLGLMVDGNIFDNPPSGPLPAMYVALGPERVRDASDGSDSGAWHEFVISVVSENSGFLGAKQAAGLVCDSLQDAQVALTRGRLIGMWFRKATAKRETDGRRRIDLTFRARVEDTTAP